MPKQSAKAITKSKTKSKEAESTKQDQLQPSLNIGLVGHVDHGKTSLVKALSGKWTDTHSEEIKRGITIRLGYAEFAVYKCEKCEPPEGYSIKPTCLKCNGPAELVRLISVVDAPGHESLMATMLCGAAIMDGAILLVAANEHCPQPQTQEHIKALEIIGVKHLLVVQNKIDLVPNDKAKENYGQIKDFLKGTPYENAPILPISAVHNVNIDILLQAILECFPLPERDPKADPLMLIARSFDVNKPGALPENMQGGVLGGALKQGQLCVGDEIAILPGIMHEKSYKPLTTTIIGLVSAGRPVKCVQPGGTFGALTSLDPNAVRADTLSGNIVGKSKQMPQVWNEITLKLHLLERVVGAKDKLVVEPIKPNELLMLNVNSAATVGVASQVSKNQVKLNLRRPVAAHPGARVTISRSLGQRWRLIGWGDLLEK